MDGTRWHSRSPEHWWDELIELKLNNSLQSDDLVFRGIRLRISVSRFWRCPNACCECCLSGSQDGKWLPHPDSRNTNRRYWPTAWAVETLFCGFIVLLLFLFSTYINYVCFFSRHFKRLMMSSPEHYLFSTFLITSAETEQTFQWRTTKSRVVYFVHL